MNNYVFGANIIENLTTGMYRDSKVIYREYIQNACDQIDKAIKQGIIEKGKEEIYIDLNLDDRTITITDNATGIRKNDFARILSSIADSDKRLGEDKGFRGIGRLCGLAYCSKLVFSSTAKGENIISKMECDAEKMRKMITENESGVKHTAKEILERINSFSEEKDNSKKEEHWFKVELIDINQENTDLLDFKNVKDYLSFIAPVPYKNTFIFRNKIYKHAKQLGIEIDEYIIKLNGEQILKEYKTNYKTRSGEDEIFDIDFKDFYDNDKQLIAWSWIGLSAFKGVIERECLMRGIRLRKENIQIGSEDTLQQYFKEDRGIHYFVGEIFGISKDLIPNAQRDFFNENPMRKTFESHLKKYFSELYRVYHGGSEVNSAFKKIDDAKIKEREFEAKQRSGLFVNNQDIQNDKENLERVNEEADKAKKKLEKIKQGTSDILIKIISHVETTRPKDSESDNQTGFDKGFADKGCTTNENPPKYITDVLSKLSKRERKLISTIYAVIKKSVDEKTAKIIIDNIQTELK